MNVLWVYTEVHKPKSVILTFDLLGLMCIWFTYHSTPVFDWCGLHNAFCVFCQLLREAVQQQSSFKGLQLTH